MNMETKEIGTVKVLGPGCPRCQETKKLVFNALAELQIAADVQEVSDGTEIAKLGVRFTPAVIVGNEILVQGRIPKPEELKKWFLERAAQSLRTK
jgi:small redox-active disulfide protein 2